MRSIYKEPPSLNSIDLYFRDALVDFGHALGLNEVETFKRCVINHFIAHIETYTGKMINNFEELSAVNLSTFVPGLTVPVCLAYIDAYIDARLGVMLSLSRKAKQSHSVDCYEHKSAYCAIFYIPPKTGDEFGLFIVRLKDSERAK